MTQSDIGGGHARAIGLMDDSARKESEFMLCLQMRQWNMEMVSEKARYLSMYVHHSHSHVPHGIGILSAAARVIISEKFLPFSTGIAN